MKELTGDIIAMLRDQDGAHSWKYGGSFPGFVEWLNGEVPNREEYPFKTTAILDYFSEAEIIDKWAMYKLEHGGDNVR